MKNTIPFGPAFRVWLRFRPAVRWELLTTHLRYHDLSRNSWMVREWSVNNM